MANILLWQQLKSNKTRRRLRKVEGGVMMDLQLIIIYPGQLFDHTFSKYRS